MKLTRVIGFVVVLSGLSSLAFAGVVPELDPNVAGSAFAIIGGAVLVIRGRRRR